MGRVERITDFGAFIEIMPGVDGLLHVSEIANYRVKDVRDELKEGEQVMVKVINIDPSGKVRLSRKALLGPDEGTAPATRARCTTARSEGDGPRDHGRRTAAAETAAAADRGGTKSQLYSMAWGPTPSLDRSAARLSLRSFAVSSCAARSRVL